MKYSKKIQKAIQSVAKHYLEFEESGSAKYLNILSAYNDIYGQIFPNNDWSNINDEWVENWGNKTFTNLLNHENNKDQKLFKYLHDLEHAIKPSNLMFQDDPSGELIYELLEISLRLDDHDVNNRRKKELKNEIKSKYFNTNINRIKNENLSTDEVTIINSIKKNNFNISFNMYNNNITDRSKYSYNLGKINNYLIEYCQNNNLNIIFIGTGTHYANGLGRYKRFGLPKQNPSVKDHRLDQAVNLGLDLLPFLTSNKKEYEFVRTWFFKFDFIDPAHIERQNYFPEFYKMFDKVLNELSKNSDPPNFLNSRKDNISQSYESHLYAPFENTYFEYINKLWGDLPIIKNNNFDPIHQYYIDETSAGAYDPARDPDEIYDIDLAWKKHLIFWDYDPDNPSIPEEIHEKFRYFKYTKEDFLKEHKKSNKDNLQWIKFSAKVLLPITYTCNMGINGAEFNLTNLELLFKNKILNKSKTLLVIENNGFKNNDFITKTSSFPNRIIFDTGDIGINKNIKLNMSYKNEFVNKYVSVTEIAMPLYNYFLPILKVLLELSPFTKTIKTTNVNSSLLSNKVIKDIVATHLINANNLLYIDPSPIDMNSIQNFERNFNSAIYILRKSGYIEQGKLIITTDAVKKIRKYIENPNIYPIIITHSNNRTKYLIGETTYWSTSEQIENKLDKDQIKNFKELTKDKVYYDSSVINFIKSFSKLNKLITLPGEKEKELNNLDIEYVNYSMAILDINKNN